MTPAAWFSGLRARVLLLVALAMLSASAVVSAAAGADRVPMPGLLAAGAALLLALAVAWAGSELLILRQVRALVAATSRITAGDLESRTGLRAGPDELNQLARAFDEMAETLQRRAEKILSQHDALARQASRFRALIERSSDGILLTDMDGTLRYVSPSTTRILGHAPGGLLGDGVFGLVHADDREQAYAGYAAILARPGAHGTSAMRVRHRDGRWRWIEFTLTNLLHEPAVQAVVVNYRDVTENPHGANHQSS